MLSLSEGGPFWRLRKGRGSGACTRACEKGGLAGLLRLQRSHRAKLWLQSHDVSSLKVFRSYPTKSCPGAVAMPSSATSVGRSGGIVTVRAGTKAVSWQEQSISLTDLAKTTIIGLSTFVIALSVSGRPQITFLLDSSAITTTGSTSKVLEPARSVTTLV